ncbi:TPA: DNA double-strand break repair nuclease NurA [Candidatus Woesearchaeota archaeon]|nr:DNA double-strand break repair nuclease NurA [Candidatus Woesearchaeota archaeon]
MEKVFNSITKEIEDSISFDSSDMVDFSHLGYTSVPFSKDNFHPIPLLTKSPCGPKVCFIDGGNAELFSSSSLSLSFIRVLHTVYQDNRRVSLHKDEFFCLVIAKEKDGRLIFEAKLFPSVSGPSSLLTDSFFESYFRFDPDDRSLTPRASRLSISSVPGFIRRLAELSTALLLTKDLKAGDSVVIDGSFESRLDDEAKLIDTLGALSKENRVSVAGLSKTSQLLTSDGSSPALLLAKHAPPGSWYYYPVADTPFDLYFVKLHPQSDYIFRLDLLTSKDASSLLSSLAHNSTDPVFLGYPYGLIEADRFARVSNHEKEFLRTNFFTRAGASSGTLRLLQRSLDAHSVLDNIS